ncbi:MAG: hypothetical protein R2708_08675 [Vicinamibacterales bacterium]
MRGKLGLSTTSDGDAALADGLLAWMQQAEADYTNTFRLLARRSDVEALAAAGPIFGAWHARWATPAEAARPPRRPAPRR